MRRRSSLMGAPLNILSYGENHYKPNSVYRSVHAEDHAIQKLPTRPSKQKRYQKVDILVIRVSKTGQLGNSKPCHSCLMLLSKQLPERGYTLSRVYYSDDQGKIQVSKLSNLLFHEEHHFSRYQKEQMLQKNPSVK
jgi:cytidine deaminase